MGTIFHINHTYRILQDFMLKPNSPNLGMNQIKWQNVNMPKRFSHFLYKTRNWGSCQFRPLRTKAGVAVPSHSAVPDSTGNEHVRKWSPVIVTLHVADSFFKEFGFIEWFWGCYFLWNDSEAYLWNDPASLRISDFAMLKTPNLGFMEWVD